MVSIQVYIEGGGSTRAEQGPLREAFKAFFDKLKLPRQPKVKCGGGRGEVFKEFKIAMQTSPEASCLLLIDSEGPVSGSSPWDHIAKRVGDQWERPANATDDHLHLMVETMEAWLAADPEALAAYYGSGFKSDKLPPRANLEEVPKADLKKALEGATKDAKTKGKYAKSHAFDLIAKIDPAKVRVRCPGFAARFFDALETASKKAVVGPEPSRKRR